MNIKNNHCVEINMNVRNHKIHFFDGKGSDGKSIIDEVRDFLMVCDAFFSMEHDNCHFGTYTLGLVEIVCNRFR